MGSGCAGDPPRRCLDERSCSGRHDRRLIGPRRPLPHRVRRSIDYIPNGVARRRPRPASEITVRYGLHPGSYVLFVGRLVPEKAPDLLVRAFRRVPGDDVRLVIVGGSSHTDRYAARVRHLAAMDPRVLMTGYVYGSALEELYSNCAAFVLPSSMEGQPRRSRSDLVRISRRRERHPTACADRRRRCAGPSLVPDGRRPLPRLGRSMRRSNAIRVSTRRRCASPMRSRRSTTGMTWREPQKSSTND